MQRYAERLTLGPFAEFLRKLIALEPMHAKRLKTQRFQVAPKETTVPARSQEQNTQSPSSRASRPEDPAYRSLPPTNLRQAKRGRENTLDQKAYRISHCVPLRSLSKRPRHLLIQQQASRLLLVNDNTRTAPNENHTVVTD